jgi:hypothetical protein
MYTVTKAKNGNWLVKQNGAVVAKCKTNAEAWRIVDRKEGEPISQSEKTTEWLNERD